MSTTIYSVENSIATVVINRPEKKNALNRETIASLTQHFIQAHKDPLVRAVLFTAQGEEAFCAGADLKELAALSTASELEGFFGEVAELIETIHRCEKPVIGAIKGIVRAGGVGLVAACDVVYASENANFALPEIQRGIVPMVIMAPLSRSVQRKALADLVLSGDTFSAKRAEEIGLVSRVFPATKLSSAVEKFTTHVIQQSGIALARAKEALLTVPEQEYFSLFRPLSRQVALLSLSEDGREGISSFVEKRAPQWKHR